MIKIQHTCTPPLYICFRDTFTYSVYDKLLDDGSFEVNVMYSKSLYIGIDGIAIEARYC